jgi:RNA polymerase-interacting CarD/CdnL/TRCF family regulator
MRESSGSLSSSWKVRSRRNLERLSSGDPLQLYEVYQGLQELKEKKGRLNNSDRKQHSQALELLTEELSLALDKTPEQTQLLLEEVVSKRSDAA